MSISPQRQLRVRQHRPIQRLLLLAAVLAGGLAALWQAYSLGTGSAGYAQEQVLAARAAAELRIEQLMERNADLLRRNAELGQSAEIDRVAHEEVRAALVRAEQELAELRQELVFYRNLMAPGENEPGLRVEAVSLTPELVADAYRYEIVLTQVRGKDRLAQGQLLVRLHGVLDGDARALNLADVTPDGDAALRFRFKYFQTLDGILELPQGFEPQTLELEAVSSVKGIKSITRTFDWAQLTSGGEQIDVGQD